MTDKADATNKGELAAGILRPEDKLPPELPVWRRVLRIIGWILMAVGLIYVANFCFSLLIWREPSLVCFPCAYLALLGLLAGLVCYFLAAHPLRVHKERLLDRSEVEATIQEARHVVKEQSRKDWVADYDQKCLWLEQEACRLEKNVGPKGWAEYQVLTLESLLIDFLTVEDLVARARSYLVELREYAHGEAFSYNVELYYEWQARIDGDIQTIEEGNPKGENGDGVNSENEWSRAEPLRANLKSLLEHIADYELKWARGTTIVSGIRICSSAAVVVFLVMGILPILGCAISSPTLHVALGIPNWGFLGVAGAMASVLLGLRKSDEVEVGDTGGKKELWRAVLGAPLGLLAGVLIFAALKGGLFQKGSLVPDLSVPSWTSASRSIVWGVVAGLGIEKVFERVRTTTDS